MVIITCLYTTDVNRDSGCGRGTGEYLCWSRDTHIGYGSCKPGAETNHHGGTEERAAKEPRK